MGLCKCPKKKVTNLFCFEHRVNVCEHCLVSNHAKCIVQSYLQWLQDSDYDPTCRLCGKNLSEEDGGDCVRLVCYDVFHWACLDHYARQLPANTAPAGYTCPICKSGVFPAHNVASPVAEALRDILLKVNWARTGLGLPLIDEPPTRVSDVMRQAPPGEHSADLPLTHTHASSNNLSSMGNNPPAYAHNPALTGRSTAPVYTPGGASHVPEYSPAKPNIPDSVIAMDTVAAYVRSADKDFLAGHPADPRKLFDSTKGGADYMNMSHDHDEDKYKRRPALQWFARWFSSRSPKQRNDPNATCKKFAIVIVLGLLGLVTMIMIFAKLGRASADSDPFLDPMANPHIQVQDA